MPTYCQLIHPARPPDLVVVLDSFPILHTLESIPSPCINLQPSPFPTPVVNAVVVLEGLESVNILHESKPSKNELKMNHGPKYRR